jgi:hypothetical protein
MREQEAVKSVADLLGPWVDPDFDSGLIFRLREAWSKPFADLTNKELATFLQQRIATKHVLPEAKRRLENNIDDGTEWFDGELMESVQKANQSVSTH